MSHRKYIGFHIQQGFEHIGGIAKKMIEVKHNVEDIVEEMIKEVKLMLKNYE
jgi:hypothetical protein